MFQRILVAWDGSDVSVRAYDAAIDVTRRYDAELVAVSIAYSPAHAETAADRDESEAAARRYLEETFGELQDRAERAGVAVEHEVITAPTPAQGLIDHARDHAFDLIVCGHHRTGRAGRLLLHGVAEQLLSDGTIPLLIVSDNGR